MAHLPTFQNWLSGKSKETSVRYGNGAPWRIRELQKRSPQPSPAGEPAADFTPGHGASGLPRGATATGQRGAQRGLSAPAAWAEPGSSGSVSPTLGPRASLPPVRAGHRHPHPGASPAVPPLPPVSPGPRPCEEGREAEVRTPSSAQLLVPQDTP